jgi:hypothetical protein
MAMAQVRLGRYELFHYDLPPYCLRCGAPARKRIGKNFAWYPPWVNLLIFIGLLPAAIVALVLTKRMRVEAPMCARHRWHWAGRILAVLVSLLGIIFLTALLVVLAPPDEAGAFFSLGLISGTLLLLTGGLILHFTSIRPVEITDRSITLTGVSEEFVEALEEDRDREQDEDEEELPRRRAP